MIEETTGKINIKDIDVVVIPRILLPMCAVKGLVETLKEFFDNIYVSYKLDDIECNKTSIVSNEYREIFKKVKRKNKKKNHVYTTEMKFFIVMHRIAVADDLWYYMIQNTIKLIGENYYDSHDETIKHKGGYITIPYNMKEFEKKMKKRNKEQ